MQSLHNILFLIGAYFVGCVNGGYYLLRFLRGEDIRHQYSGTAGAKNAGRVLGRWGFSAVLGFDMLKGAVAVLAARHLGMSSEFIPWLIPALVAGHIWPLQMRFKGGKGVAVSGGALLAYDPFLFLWAGFFIFLGLATRKFSWCVAAFYFALPWLSIHNGTFHRIAAMTFTSLLVLGAHHDHFRTALKKGQP